MTTGQSMGGAPKIFWKAGAWLSLIFLVSACDSASDSADEDSESTQTQITGDDPVPSNTKNSDLAVTQLSPFRAVYELKLRKGAAATNITAYDGLLVLSLENTCEGYISNQRITAEITNSDGERILSDFISSSWETRDWLSFHYNMVNKLNNTAVEEVDSEAERSSPTQKGQVIRRKPEPETLDLPGGVEFPTQYSVALLEAARRGETAYSADMYDGSADSLTYLVTSFIGEKAIASPDEADTGGHALLTGLAYWPVEISYHDMTNRDVLPDFEVDMKMYENGVGTHLVLDYGEFSLTGALARMEMLDQPECR